MTDDASTAYICIYCPFNSDNLEALENHLARTHEHGCQDVPPSLVQSSTSSNIMNKASKRGAPEDEQSSSSSSLNGIKQTADYSSGVKRIKRTLSPPTLSTVTLPNLFVNRDIDNSEEDEENSEDEDEDDERDSPSNPATKSPNTFLTCPICSSTYHRLGHFLRHAKRKHHVDLSNYHGPHTFDMLTAQIHQMETANMDLKKNATEEIDVIKTEEINALKKSTQPTNEPNSVVLMSETNATTDCPYCDYKTTDIEQFKSHIVAHIRDKNYRCLLCNRLYKYRGDCSFHIRRKHHRYSANSNDYIQRFLFDTTDGDETMSTQSGGYGSLINGSGSNANAGRELDEPVRYFGCPYCDYTSNYGGDVRKHQARKHPNAESKVIKIIRQDLEPQIHSSLSTTNHYPTPTNHDDDDERDSHAISKPNVNLIEQQERKDKIKTIKKTDGNIIHSHPTALPILSNFAPVRVFQCSSCHQQGTYKWVVERHIRAKHPDQPEVHVIELPAELAVKLQKITPPLKRFRCSLCPLQSKHTWVIIRHIKHFHTLQTASVLDIQPDGTPINEESFSMQNGDLPGNKSYTNDSESSSTSSSCIETGPDGQADFFRHQDIEDEDDEIDPNRLHTNGAMSFTYKCSLCDFISVASWSIQKHINDVHPGQPNVHMLTQCRPAINNHHHHHHQQKFHSKKSKHKNGGHTTIATVMKIPAAAPMSPTSALAKAKFSPAVEEALLSLQGSKINTGIYAVQPKFGIKRLKCRHCFYRSNWKTDMIRHVRIRHNLTEPDHNKDMIVMSEQEARSTIETYENTFGKELRRRTFRTWNDWAKAEEEFTPKDGSLQYSNAANEAISTNNQKSKKSTTSLTNSINDDTKRVNKPKVKQEPRIIPQNYAQSLAIKKEEFKPLPNPSNIVSRLLLTASPTHHNDDDTPLDLSLKPSSIVKINHHEQIDDNDQERTDMSEEDEGEEEDDSSTVNYFCSVCSYKRSSYSSMQQHVSIHLTGQGFVCPVCSYVTSTNNSMLRHFTTTHPTSQTITQFPLATRMGIASIIEQHQCPVCSYQCDRSEALDVHRRLEHEDEEFDIDSSSSIIEDDGETCIPVDKNTNLFQCPSCPSSSTMDNHSNLEQLTLHVFTDHLHHNQSCPFCSFVAHSTSTYSLLEHIKLHFNGTLVQPDVISGIENVKELLME